MQTEVGKLKIGILDIHGSVVEHANCLEKLAVEVCYIKLPEDLKGISGLIIPGGESTTMSKLLKKFALDKAIVKFASNGLPVWGSCAGAILLGGDLALMNARIERNAYGRQLDSFETVIDFNEKRIPAVFIRAPKIMELSPEIKELANYNGDVVAAQKENIIISTFHPELTEDLSFHKYFLNYCFSFGLFATNNG